jgi:adenylosuccinate synthase
VDPTGLLNEYDVLRGKGIEPALYIDGQCPITTPYEKERNQNSEKTLNHGTVGVGVGQTYQREEDHYSLTAYDLLYPWVFETKLKLLKKYYTFLGWSPKDIPEEFLEDCRELMRLGSVNIVSKMPDYKNIVFEGAQGLLLDQNFGFFPHVSRGNTGMKNINEMGFAPTVYLVTRAYQTRHGNGPMSNEGISGFKEFNPYEKNTNTGFQGKFRTAPLDLSLLRYAIGKDSLMPTDKTLVVTCLDCLESYILSNGESSPMVYKDEKSFLDGIKKYLGINKMIVSRSPFTESFF